MNGCLSKREHKSVRTISEFPAFVKSLLITYFYASKLLLYLSLNL